MDNDFVLIYLAFVLDCIIYWVSLSAGLIDFEVVYGVIVSYCLLIMNQIIEEHF